MLMYILLLALPTVAFASFTGNPTFAADPAQYVDGDSVVLKCEQPDAIGFTITKGGTADTGFTDALSASTPKTEKTIAYSTADAGTYTCESTDGSATGTADLTLAAHVLKPTLAITIPANNAAYTDGTGVTITCSTTTPGVTYSFKKDNTDYTGSDVDTSAGTITIASYSASTNDGSYTCKATKDSKELESDALAVVVVLKPTLAITIPANNAAYTDGTPVTITCSTTTSGVTYSFKKDNTDYTSSDVDTSAGTITIASYSAATNDGSYTCKATKSGREVESDALTVGNSAAQMMTSVVLLPLCVLVASVIY